MKILNVEQNSDAWLELRKGKITGSKLKDIVVKRGTNEKIGFYQLIADRLSIEDDSEDPMERGHTLEQEAINTFMKATGKDVVRCGMWVSDENPNIAYSPDGAIPSQNGDFTEAIEIKCLSASRHLEAYFTQQIPSDYEYQVLQAFIVNEKLEKLYFCFYDPRVIAKPFFFIKVSRKEKEEDIKTYLEYQKNTLAKIENLITSLTF
jgi:putative phage-type endonuclease